MKNAIAMRYPENNDPLYCFLYCKFGVSDAVIDGQKCLVVHYDDGISKIKEIAKKFNLATFSVKNANYGLSRLKEFTIDKHTPRQNLGMLCERVYNKYFN